MRMNMRGVVLVLLLLVDASVSEEFTPGWSESYYIENVEYMTIFDQIQKNIEDNRDKTDNLEDGSVNPILKPQELNSKPDFWFVPLLFGRGISRTEFAFRDDNLYMSAFSNGAGNWFSFDITKGEYELDGTTSVGFKNNYRDLVKEFPEKGSGKYSWEKLEGLDISRDSVLKSIDVVNAYDKKKTPVHIIKKALVILIVVFIESQRFPHIRQLVYEAWETGVGTLDKKGAELVVNWRRISCAIRIWDASSDKARWDSREATELKNSGLGITTPESAKAAIYPILQSNNCSK